MKSFRLWSMSAVALVAVASLQADTLPVDGHIKLVTGGGGGSIEINSTTCPSSGCMVSKVNEVIGANGFANISIDNELGVALTALNIFIPTTNFDQPFTSNAVTPTNAPAFQNSFVTTGLFDALELPFFCGIATGGVISTGCIEVKFSSGAPTDPTKPCSATNQLNPCTINPDAEDIAEGPGNPGFAPGQEVVVQAFFGGNGNGFPGLPAHTDASLQLTDGTIPEPSMLWLSLSGLVGLLVASRKLQKA